MVKLIINADDFGFNREITDGIIECHRAGTVTSTTLMVNMPAAEYAASLITQYPNLSVGIHLNLTVGRPVLDASLVPSLVDEQGLFLNYREMFKRSFRFQLNPCEVGKEFSAQVEKFLSYGIQPTHSDSHHHVADCPQVFPVKTKVLQKYGIRRIRTQRGWYRRDKQFIGLQGLSSWLFQNFKKSPNRLYYEFQYLYCRYKGFIQPDERFSPAKLVSGKPLDENLGDFEIFLANCPDGIIEHTVHPGLPSDDPMDEPEYRIHRKKEYDLLMNPEYLKMCQLYDIQLINFTQF
jgi:predicted glycoside hydrolase/deacetylase ChbG (UPF0249 family)